MVWGGRMEKRDEGESRRRNVATIVVRTARRGWFGGSIVEGRMVEVVEGAKLGTGGRRYGVARTIGTEERRRVERGE